MQIWILDSEKIKNITFLNSINKLFSSLKILTITGTCRLIGDSLFPERFRSLFHGFTGCGAANLRLPTGGSAYGMPLKLNIGFSCLVWVILPLILPKEVKTMAMFLFCSSNSY